MQCFRTDAKVSIHECSGGRSISLNQTREQGPKATIYKMHYQFYDLPMLTHVVTFIENLSHYLSPGFYLVASASVPHMGSGDPSTLVS